jgi:acetyl-CoA carboxylase biotin carboxyl carrier protein
MSTNDQNQTQPGGGEQVQGAGTAAAPQAEASSQSSSAGGARERHGRRRHNRPDRERRPQSSQPRRSESTLNMDELRELTELFSTHGLTDFEFENADIRIRLARNPAPVVAAAPAIAPAVALNPLAALHSAASVHAQTAPHATAATEASAAKPSSEETQAEEELHVITSPIVGTFYRSPSPTADPFVRAGSHVEHDTVVCIIEAMKLMNEIQAETSGTVAKIYVENGQPVEYGQPLFGVKK